jgi:polysaccharide export outer membrane protein
MKYLIVVFTVLFTGCSVKEYRLFQNEDPSLVSQAQDINISYDSKIIPDDILKIDIYNMNQKENILNSNSLSPSIDNEYIVSTDGTIYLPLLQEVEIRGLTIKELNKKLTKKYKRYLKQPYIKTSIKNHKVFVLGEIGGKGVIPISGNSISIIEVISRAGGFTDHSQRDRVRIISKEEGKHKMRTIDFTKLSMLNTDNLMLRHNTIVYVEPKGTKAIKVGIQDYLPIIQSISAIAGTILTFDYLSNGKN